jgi:hypothetical protein
VHAKHRYKDQKFGLGGKKQGMKRNTKNSTSDVSSLDDQVNQSDPEQHRNINDQGKTDA